LRHCQLSPRASSVTTSRPKQRLPPRVCSPPTVPPWLNPYHATNYAVAVIPPPSHAVFATAMPFPASTATTPHMHPKP